MYVSQNKHAEKKESLTPVSYTHLDVYKRQAFSQLWCYFHSPSSIICSIWSFVIKVPFVKWVPSSRKWLGSLFTLWTLITAMCHATKNPGHFTTAGNIEISFSVEVPKNLHKPLFPHPYHRQLQHH